MSELTYQQAVDRLELIVKELESGQVEVDKLIQKAEEAMKLLKFCNSKLKNVESEMDNLLTEIN